MTGFKLAESLTVRDLAEFSEIARHALADTESINIDGTHVGQIDILGLQAIVSLAGLASSTGRTCDVLIDRAGAVDKALVLFGFRQPDEVHAPAPYHYREMAS